MKPRIATLVLVAELCLASAAAAVSGEGQRLDAPAIYARAEKAIAGITNLHIAITSGDAYVPAGYRHEVWQQGDSYRSDDGRYVFVLGERYGLRLDRRANIAQAALRQASDGEFFLEAGKLQREFRAREAAGQLPASESQQPATRSRNGGEEVGITTTVSLSRDGDASQGQLETVMWFDTTTWLPTQISRTNRDGQGTVVNTWHGTYEYDLPLPAGFFSPKEPLRQDTVVVGWEHLRDLAAGEAVASETLQVGGRDATVEVCAVEKLPQDHLLIVGRVADAWPEWLGAHVRLRERVVRESVRHHDYSLALQGRILTGPWYGGGRGGPMPFFMVFAPEGYGETGGGAFAEPSLTFRAWGVAPSPTDSGAIEGDMNANLTLPAPMGPPVVHELAPEIAAD